MQSSHTNFLNASIGSPLVWENERAFISSAISETVQIPNARIYLEEMKVFLDYKTRKSCRRWCQTLYVELYRDIGTLKKYALRTDFTLKYLQFHVAKVYNTLSEFKAVNMDKKGNRVIIDLPMDKPLRIPDELKATGLTVYCYKCQRNVSEICRSTGKPIEECDSGDRHVFKLYGDVGDGKRKTFALDTRDPLEASRQAKEILQKLRQQFQPLRKNHSHNTHKEKSESLRQTMQQYISFLRNENVPWQKVEARTEDHIKDVERAMKVFGEACQEQGIDTDKISIYDIDDDVAGIVCQYLIEIKEFSSRTYDKYLTLYTSFFSWCIKQHDATLTNYFQGISRDNADPPEPVAISKKNYEALLKIISKDRGIKNYESGVKKIRNLYRPWLIPGIKLGLETGLRREQLISLRYSDIFQHEDGRFYIKSENLKSNRIRKGKGSNQKRYVYVRITESLKSLLFELGYDQHKHTDAFILAPNVQIKRNRILSDTLTKGFSHFYAQLETSQPLTFKSLRKRYMTSLRQLLGDNAKYVSGHSSGDGVLDKNYIDRKEIAKLMDNFEIFSPDNDRKHELSEFRNNKLVELTLDK